MAACILDVVNVMLNVDSIVVFVRFCPSPTSTTHLLESNTYRAGYEDQCTSIPRTLKRHFLFCTGHR